MATTITRSSPVARTVASLTLCAALSPALAQYTPPTAAQEKGARQDRAAAEYLVVDCQGRYVRTGRMLDGPVESGMLQVSSAGGPAAALRMDGCAIEDVQLLRPQGALVAITSRDGFLDAGGKRRYAVASFDLSTLRPRGSYDIPAPQSEAPRLMLPSSGRSIFVAYAPAQPSRSSLSLDRLDPATMRVQASGAMAESAASKLSAAKDVAVDDAGNLKIDATPIATYASVSSDVNALRAVVSFWKSATRAETARTQGDTGDAKFAFAGSAGGLAAYIAGWDMSRSPYKHGYIVVYDLARNAVAHAFKTDFRLAPFDGTVGTPNVHLTPSGATLIVEPYEWATAAGNIPVRSKTGELVAYDTRSGNLLGSVKTAPPGAQVGRIVGFSADGKSMFHVSSDKFLVIDIASMTITSSASLPRGFEAVAALSLK